MRVLGSNPKDEPITSGLASDLGAVSENPCHRLLTQARIWQVLIFHQYNFINVWQTLVLFPSCELDAGVFFRLLTR